MLYNQMMPMFCKGNVTPEAEVILHNILVYTSNQLIGKLYLLYMFIIQRENSEKHHKCQKELIVQFYIILHSEDCSVLAVISWLDVLR